jgi:7,8-dihydropterin-6-yl-methyl-4-(beta-D-ribofuranosyl)aminobenzene 5'-phosphate synthase
MLLKCLVENNAVSDDFKTEHGLSLYIETKNHRLLFDTGASSLFTENAIKLNVNLGDVDTLVLSHGHYDHGGGIKAFLNLNDKADIYLRKGAMDKHYSEQTDGSFKRIGLDESLSDNKRFIYSDDRVQIDDELSLFSNVQGNLFLPSGNESLFALDQDMMIRDDFNHEQNLVIQEAGKRILIAGCAHRGIVNIMNHMRAIGLEEPDIVIGGFHLYARSTDRTEPIDFVEALGAELMKTKSVFYTCHCTGIKAYNELKSIMGDRIHYLATGQIVETNIKGD